MNFLLFKHNHKLLTWKKRRKALEGMSREEEMLKSYEKWQHTKRKMAQRNG